MRYQEKKGLGTFPEVSRVARLREPVIVSGLFPVSGG